MRKKIRVSILGASGYAGGELLRILLGHSFVKVGQATSRQFAGQSVGRVHPNLRKITDLVFVDPKNLQSCDLLFVSLPNKSSMVLMGELQKLAPKVIDLGADFRIHNPRVFETWYHERHVAPRLLPQFVGGIAELHRKEIKKAHYVACAGCEATVSILSLYPLVKHHLIKSQEIIVDAKMSSSQGGNLVTSASHHPERAGVVRSYKPTDHRHTAEIEQELSRFEKNVKVNVSATSIEMVRGLLVTIHTRPRNGVTEKNVWRAYRDEYDKEPFMRIVKEVDGNYRYPEPKILVGTNFCDIGFALSPRENRLVAVGAIDNLGKGTAGQAVQAMNIMCGFPETAGLEFPGLHPV